MRNDAESEYCRQLAQMTFRVSSFLPRPRWAISEREEWEEEVLD